MNKRYTYYWHDYMDCQVVVDNKTTEEYPIEDNRVKDPKYDNNGIEYLVNKMNEQEERIKELESQLEFWKGSAGVCQGELGIVNNELGIALEQGYKLSGAYMEYKEDKEKEGGN